MAHVDLVRRRVTLSEPELAAVTTVGADDDRHVAEPTRLLRSALIAGGAVTDGALIGWVDDLLSVVARPALRVAVDILTTGRLVHAIWATPRFAVVGEPRDDGRTELAGIDPLLIPYALLQMIGFGRRADPPQRAPLRLPPSVLDTVSDRVRRPAQSADDADDPPAGELARLAELLDPAPVSWRMTSTWVDASGAMTTGAISVLDTGANGLWVISSADRQRGLTLEPVPASVVYERVLRLLPGREPSGALR